MLKFYLLNYLTKILRSLKTWNLRYLAIQLFERFNVHNTRAYRITYQCQASGMLEKAKVVDEARGKRAGSVKKSDVKGCFSTSEEQSWIERYDPFLAQKAEKTY